MPKIGIVTPYKNNRGGAEIYINNLINYCWENDSNNEIIVFTSDLEVYSGNSILIPDISNYTKLFFNINKVIRTIRKESIDYVVLNDIFLSQFSAYFSLFFKRVIPLIHGELKYTRLKSAFLNRLVVACRSIMIRCGTYKILLVNKVNLSVLKNDRKAIFVGNYIEKKEFKTVERKEYDFIFVGRIIKLKNLKKMIEVFAWYLKHVNNKARLLIVGDGEQKEEIVEQVKELGIDSSIKLMGYVKHDLIHEYYMISRCLLLFSITEGFPTVVLEALLYGLPCIVSNVGSNSEIIKNGYNGFVFDNNTDNETISEYMKKGLEISSDNCRESVEKYSIEEFYQRFVNSILGESV